MTKKLKYTELQEWGFLFVSFVVETFGPEWSFKRIKKLVKE